MALTTRRTFTLIVLIGLFALAARGIGDPDFWWHLRTGQQIVSTHSVPHADLYSHTKFGTPWVAHEWLSEVLIYAVYRAAGYLGLILTFALVITTAFWISFLRSAGRPYFAGAVTVWGALATIPFWGIRPQMLSLLLTSVFLLLLDRFDAIGRRSMLCWMPLTIILWVNLHAGYAVGLALVGVATVCKLIDAAIDQEGRTHALREFRALSITFALCLLAVLINPNGYRMYLYPFETLASPSMQSYISEWASPNFHSPGMQAFGAMLILTFATVIASGKRLRIRDFVLLILTAYAALRSSRHIPLFVLVAMPIMAAALESLLVSRNWLAGLRKADSPFPKTALNLSIVCAMLLFCVLRIHTVAKTQPKLESERLPVAAVSYMLRQHLPQPVFNSYEWGGYLIWTLHPHYQVFVDGRADVYGDRFLDQFVQTYKTENDWQALLHQWGINTVLLPPEAPLAKALSNDPRWSVTFQDTVSVIYVRQPSETANQAGK